MENQVVYVGPPLKKHGLSPYMVYRDGIPAAWKDDDVMKRLFVPVSGLNKAMEEVGKKGTMLHTFYQKALKEA